MMDNSSHYHTGKTPLHIDLKEQFLGDYCQLVFNDLEIGIMLIKPDGTLLKANPACLKIHQLEEKDALHYSTDPERHFSIRYPDHTELPVHRWPYSRVIKGESFKEEHLIVENTTTGHIVHASFTGKPVFDSQGDLEMGILYMVDINDQVSIQRELETETEKRKEHFRKIELYQQQLTDDRELLQTIIDTIPVMIVIYDARVEKAVLNKAVESISGWTNEDIKDKNIMELAYPDPEYRAGVREYMDSLETGFKDILMHTKDGRKIETSWANVRIPDGRQVGVGIDISSRKLMEEELIRAREKAEKENQVQSAFIQNISHEVRTPMNSILGFTEMLYKSKLGPREQEFLEAISYNGIQLLRLIDDIVDFSRLDKNEMSLTRESVRIHYLLDQTRKQFPSLKKEYNKRNLELSMILPENGDDDITLYTDLHRIQQVFNNLISNALKYTEKGHIELGYELSEVEQEIIFYVKDTGIGIKKEDHHRVFTRFNRLHDTKVAEFRGTGLGLAICKHLVELLGGRIWFESNPGTGSVFYFSHSCSRQKMDPQEAKKEIPEKKTDQVPNLTGSTILVAEDDAYSFQMIQHMLLETGATVLHADTGERALELAAENNVDIAFIDIRLPALNGYEVLSRLRGIKKTIPAIALTANALPEDKKKSHQAGFDFHATKPISMSEIYSILNCFLGESLS